MPYLKMTNRSNQRYLGLNLDGEPEVSRNYFSMSVPPCGTGVITQGKDEGPIEGLLLPAQRSIVWNLGEISPSKYNAQMEVNPKLYANADVFFQTLYDPGTTNGINLHIRTKRSVDLSELDWLVKFYLVD